MQEMCILCSFAYIVRIGTHIHTSQTIFATDLIIYLNLVVYSIAVLFVSSLKRVFWVRVYKVKVKLSRCIACIAFISLTDAQTSE